MRKKYEFTGETIDDMDVWLAGYGVACDVDGVLYCYRRA